MNACFQRDTKDSFRPYSLQTWTGVLVPVSTSRTTGWREAPPGTQPCGQSSGSDVHHEALPFTAEVGTLGEQVQYMALVFLLTSLMLYPSRITELVEENQ